MKEAVLSVDDAIKGAEQGVVDAALDGTAVDPRDPTRRCIATGERRPRAELLRFAVDPQGQLVPDFAGKLPGRGLWITPDRGIVARALSKGLFARAARRPLTVPEDLLERVETLARRRLLNNLGLARRAGAVAVGFEGVEAKLKAGKARVMLEANDGSPEGLRKLMVAARAGGLDPQVCRLFDAAELGQALGRDPVVHVALASKTFADRFRDEWRRLAGLFADENGFPDGPSH